MLEEQKKKLSKIKPLPSEIWINIIVCICSTVVLTIAYCCYLTSNWIGFWLNIISFLFQIGISIDRNIKHLFLMKKYKIIKKFEKILELQSCEQIDDLILVCFAFPTSKLMQEWEKLNENRADIQK